MARSENTRKKKIVRKDGVEQTYNVKDGGDANAEQRGDTASSAAGIIVDIDGCLSPDSALGQTEARSYDDVSAMSSSTVMGALIADLDAGIEAGEHRSELGEQWDRMSSANRSVYDYMDQQLEKKELQAGQKNRFPIYRAHDENIDKLESLADDAMTFADMRGDEKGKEGLQELLDEWRSERNTAQAMLAGFTYEQATTVTGKGARRIAGCKPDDTVANKLAANGLSMTGARNALKLDGDPAAPKPQTAQPSPEPKPEREPEPAPAGDTRIPMDPETTLQTIGGGNLMAISGGRKEAIRNDEGELVGLKLKVANGYSVDVVLDASDTYTVTRRWRDKNKGEMSGVHAEELGEVAYQASCYVNVDFG